MQCFNPQGDGCQGIVQLVSDTGRQFSHGCQLRGLPELLRHGRQFVVLISQSLLGEDSVRDVVCQYKRRRPAVEINGMSGNLDVNNAAVFLPMLPHATALESRDRMRKSPRNSRQFLRGADVLDRHSQKFLTREAIVTYCRLVNGEKTKCLAIEDPHWLWAVLK